MCAQSVSHVRLCDPTHCSLQSSDFVPKISYARILGSIAISELSFFPWVEYLPKLFEILLNEKFFSFPLQHIWSFIPITIKSLIFRIYFQFQTLLYFVQIVSALALGSSFHWLLLFFDVLLCFCEVLFVVIVVALSTSSKTLWAHLAYSLPLLLENDVRNKNLRTACCNNWSVFLSGPFS